MTPKRVVLFLAKATLSLTVLWYLVDSIGADQLFLRLAHPDPLALLAAAAIFALVPTVQALRWWIIMKGLGQYVSIARLTAFNWIGLFFNHFLPSSVGGDVVRTVYVRPNCEGYWQAAFGVLADRGFGMAALFAFAGTAAAILAQGNGEHSRFYEITALVGLAGFAVCVVVLFAGPRLMALFFADRQPFATLADVVAKCRNLLVSWQGGPIIILTSIAAQLFQALKFATTAHALQLSPDLVGILAVTPIIMLVSALPISLAGWGVREVAAVAVLPAAGIAASDAIAVSLLVGIVGTGVSLFGAVTWAALPRQRVPSKSPASTPAMASVRTTKESRWG